MQEFLYGQPQVPAACKRAPSRLDFCYSLQSYIEKLSYISQALVSALDLPPAQFYLLLLEAMPGKLARLVGLSCAVEQYHRLAVEVKGAPKEER